MSQALDDRTFESAESVELTPEQEQFTRQHFQDKGYEITVEGEEPEPEPAEPADAAPPAPAPPAPAPQAGAITTDPDIDDETKQEFQSEQSKPDGEKLSRWAKRTQKLREAERTLAEKDGRIAELQRQLAERGNAPVAEPKTSSLAPQPVAQAAPPVAEVKPPEPEKPKAFDKPRPEKPKFENFQTADDPIAAHADAVADWNEKLFEWGNEKRDFEHQEAQRIEQAKSAQTQTRTWQENRLAEARKAHADFDQLTGHVVYEPVLTFLFTDPQGVPDGMDLGYEVARPENQKFFTELKAKVALTPDEAAKVQKGEVVPSVGTKVMVAREELAVFRYDLLRKKNGDLANAGQPPAAAPPAPNPPAAAPAPTQQTPPPAPPRREEAAPTPVRGRGTTGDRLEDIDPNDSDARRAWKKRNAMM